MDPSIGIKIYTQRKVPLQWLVSKTIPVFISGDKKDIANYRPISNLCSSSKIFEKLILKRILEIQDEEKVYLTCSAQHGFKKNRTKRVSSCWSLFAKHICWWTLLLFLKCIILYSGIIFLKKEHLFDSSKTLFYLGCQMSWLFECWCCLAST